MSPGSAPHPHPIPAAAPAGSLRLLQGSGHTPFLPPLPRPRITHRPSPPAGKRPLRHQLPRACLSPAPSTQHPIRYTSPAHTDTSTHTYTYAQTRTYTDSSYTHMHPSMQSHKLIIYYIYCILYSHITYTFMLQTHAHTHAPMHILKLSARKETQGNLAACRRENHSCPWAQSFHSREFPPSESGGWGYLFCL